MSNNKSILITGVSSGIGYATCQYLLQKGYYVFGSVRKEKDAKRLQNELGNQFKALIFDVTDEVAIQQAVKIVEKEVGNNGLTALVNNAGICVFGPLKYLEVSEFEEQMNINVFGLLKVTKAFLPLLGAEKNTPVPTGKIINISSVSALFTTPFLVPYCASKMSVEAISDGLRRELLPYGVDVVSIQPGPVQTSIWEKAAAQENKWKGTDYDQLINKSFQQMETAKAKAIPAEKVAKLIEGVLCNRKRKTRYVITANPWPLRLANWLPPRLIDYFLKKMMRFD